MRTEANALKGRQRYRPLPIALCALCHVADARLSFDEELLVTPDARAC